MIESILALNILIPKGINIQKITLVTEIFFILHFIKYLTTFNK